MQTTGTSLKPGRRAACGLVMLMAGWCCVADLNAQDAKSTERAYDEQRASYVMQVFRETCASNFADPGKVAEVAAKYAFPASPAYARELLYGKPGKAWDASAGGAGAVALVLVESGGWACQVHARNTDAALLQFRFRQLMENLRSPGMKVEKYDQRRGTQGAAALTQAGYFLVQEGKDQGWTFVLTTSTPNAPGWHATFTVASAYRER